MLLSPVWLLPIVLGYFGVTDPGLAYRASPAESGSTPWAQQTPGDIATIETFARIIGAGLIALGLGGLLVTWWAMPKGRVGVVAATLAASLLVLVVAAYYHASGYWAVWPLGIVAGLWVAGAIAAVAWLVLDRRAREGAGRPDRRGPAA